MRRSLLLSALVLLSAAPALAWDVMLGVTFRVTSEVSLEASSDASTMSSNDENDAQALGARPAAAQPLPAAQVPAIIPEVPVQACSETSACGPGLQCAQGLCVTAPPAVPADPCQDTSHCADGEQCFDGQCVPPSSVLERGLELQLRARATELREELALGQGPLLAALAAYYRVDARAFGRRARAHREELVSLMKDGRGWPRRCSQRLEALAAEAQPPRVARW